MSASSFRGAFINGAWTGGDGLSSIDVTNPATGEACGTISACGAIEANSALEAAKAAAGAWGKASINERAEHIERYKAKLVENKDAIVALLCQETGKVTGNAGYDFQMLTDCLSHHVEEARRCYGALIPSPTNEALSYTTYSPVGVVVAVLTWNFPLLNLGYKLGPILASGCTCVIKPSEETPLATSFCLGLLAECGFPAGVVNCVNGTGVSLIEPLCASTIPRLLTTIGSTVMGRRMVGYSATSIKRFSLELGGDAPVVLFADADIDKAVNDFLGLKFANGGQICVSPNRVLIEESIYEEVLLKIVAIANKYVYGSGDDHAGTEEVLQPVVSQAALDRLLGMVADAKAGGARVLTGGAAAADTPGFFLQPTVIADVTGTMSCQSSEIFGPILAARSFKTADEAFEVANDTEMGLSAYIYTGSLATALRAEREVMCGNVLINGAHYSIELPHGGLKQSGSGKDISNLSMVDYSDIRRITIKR
jgi:acyl-CoA reductase-like NAD-dependent aldehyde dehydrogenase